MSKEDRDARDARKARARELQAKRRSQNADRIEQRLTEEAAEQATIRAHEARTGQRDRITRGTDRISRKAADAFQKEVGLSPEEFRQALLYDRNRTRAHKSVEAFNAVVRRLEKGEIDKAQALLKTHTGRFKDSAEEGAKVAKDFEKKYGKRPRSGSGSTSTSQSSSGGVLGGFGWWLRGGR